MGSLQEEAFFQWLAWFINIKSLYLASGWAICLNYLKHGCEPLTASVLKTENWNKTSCNSHLIM